ncbi:MAG: 4Fe-4S binding protein [Candidatus Kariarchaeaceae archaeon]|jgi:formate hydrogenlyase subunit 6/NADH:ubiquinone oxidoreductase subunit I
MSVLKEYLSASKEAIHNLFRKPNTILFPNEHVITTAAFRGKPVLVPENCTVCLKCERVCPTGAITIEKQSDVDFDFGIDLGRCCYCQECEDACNFNAITLTDQWMTSSLTKADLLTIEVVHKKKKVKIEG